MADSTNAPSEERPSSPAPEPIAFTVKAANENKYSVSLPPTATIAELKEKLAQMSDVSVERQRLIYSGRVMKNEETLEFYKVKSGNTVHMVKGAVSNTNAAGGNAGGGSAAASGSNPAVAGVPRNLAAGSGNNPLAGLTGARYAGHVQLPSADMFGPDGGMGPPPDPEGIAQAMSNPMFQAQMNEMLQNPQLLDYIISSNPMLQAMGPEARQLMQSDMFRQMMTNPDVIRQMSRVSRGPGGMPGFGGAAPSFPAPGATDTTEGQQPQQPQSQAQSPGANPFAALFGAPSSGSPPPVNPFLGSLYNNPFGGTPAAAPPSGGSSSPNQPASPPPQLPPNPLFNPAAMQNLLSALNAGAPAAGSGASPPPPANSFAGLFGGMPPAAASPPDTRPPEERYADQLRQLNDMGFFDFDRNVEALRRSGGSVQGAVNQLLGG